MRSVTLVAVLGCSLFTTRLTGQARPIDGVIVAERPYRLLPWDSLSDGQRRELQRSTTAPEYEALRRDRGFTLRKVAYGSDGLRVVAYLGRPVHPANRKLPVVVYAKGSYITGDQAPVQAPMLRRFAQAGMRDSLVIEWFRRH